MSICSLPAKTVFNVFRSLEFAPLQIPSKFPVAVKTEFTTNNNFITHNDEFVLKLEDIDYLSENNSSLDIENVYDLTQERKFESEFENKAEENEPSHNSWVISERVKLRERLAKTMQEINDDIAGTDLTSPETSLNVTDSESTMPPVESVYFDDVPEVNGVPSQGNCQEQLERETKLEPISYNEMERTLLQKNKEAEALQNLVDTLTMDINAMKAEKMCFQQSAVTEAQQVESLESGISRLRAELGHVQLELAQLTNSPHVKSLTSRSQSQVDEFYCEGDISKLSNAMEDLKKQLLENNMTLQEKEKDIEDLKTELSSLKGLLVRKDGETTRQRIFFEREIEDLNISMEEQKTEINDYRNKYLLAQERVEELNIELFRSMGQLDRLRNETSQEIRNIKAQCQIRMESADLLAVQSSTLQRKLDDVMQGKILAENLSEESKIHLAHLIDANLKLQSTLENERSLRISDAEERKKFDAKMAEVETINSELKSQRARLEECVHHLEQEIAEKAKQTEEITTLLDEKKADEMRLFRSKERSEQARRSLQVTLADAERDLAAARALAKDAVRERDEVRNSLQTEIRNLEDVLETSQNEWRALESHVVSLQQAVDHPDEVPRQNIVAFTY